MRPGTKLFGIVTVILALAAVWLLYTGEVGIGVFCAAVVIVGAFLHIRAKQNK